MYYHLRDPTLAFLFFAAAGVVASCQAAGGEQSVLYEEVGVLHDGRVTQERK
jgi:hypothetical protein